MIKHRKAITLRDVAKRANVSLSTASNVINEKQSVDPDIRRRVLDIVEELGYNRTSGHAYAIEAATHVVGVISPDITDPVTTLIFKGIENIARIHGYTSFLCDAENSTDLETKHVESLLEKGVDGLLIVPSSDSLLCLKQIRQRNCPLVVVERKIADDQVSFVNSDNTEGAYQAVKYLISLGHKDIAMITGRPRISTCVERHMGYRKAMQEFGLPVNEDLILQGNFDWGQAYQRVDEVIRRKVPLTAIFAANDVMAFGAREALEANGLRIPKDISLIGYNDIVYAGAISLTTVALEPIEMGRNAALLLLDLITKRRTSPSSIIMNPRLIIRNSCRKVD